MAASKLNSSDDPYQNPDAGASLNRIIHGDNLEALKSLLPEFEGRVNCIYIDPPYNTGNEGWVYNDAVNDPKIKKWLGKVVGPEGDDLSRHDKWLCMMYPRLKLLWRLLSSDGVFLMSLDANEYRFAEILMDEIFGASNRIETLVWKKSYGGGAKSKHVVNLHEYILCFAKNKDELGVIELPPDKETLRYYKFSDEKLEERGPYRLQPLATNSMDTRPNLRFPINFDGEEIWPEKQWQWSKDRVMTALAANELVIQKTKGGWSVNYKQYLRNLNGEDRGSKLYSIIDSIYTQQGTNEIKAMFGDGKTFDFPKPSDLIKMLLQAFAGKDAIVLDSFAGSGTTAHAVLKLNAQDGGNRRFILIETMDYAETVTAERVRRVISGYGESNKTVMGLGGSFDYYTVGERLLLEDGMLNPAVGLPAIRDYVAWTEGISIGQCTPLVPIATEGNASSPSWLGEAHGLGVFFVWDDTNPTTLDLSLLTQLVKRTGRYLIYADQCALGEDFMRRHNITYKKIPRDITRL